MGLNDLMSSSILGIQCSEVLGSKPLRGMPLVGMFLKCAYAYVEPCLNRLMGQDAFRVLHRISLLNFGFRASGLIEGLDQQIQTGGSGMKKGSRHWRMQFIIFFFLQWRRNQDPCLLSVFRVWKGLVGEEPYQRKVTFPAV